jgi:hypothetical protein
MAVGHCAAGRHTLFVFVFGHWCSSSYEHKDIESSALFSFCVLLVMGFVWDGVVGGGFRFVGI